MIDQHQHTRSDEDRVCELHPREAAQVLQVEDVAADAESGGQEREAVDEGEQGLRGDYDVDEAAESFAGEDGVLFDELGEVVEARGDGEGEEEEAEEEASVALGEGLVSDDREDWVGGGLRVVVIPTLRFDCYGRYIRSGSWSLEGSMVRE